MGRAKGLDECYICSGLMRDIDSIVEKMVVDVERKYEFGSFLIGLTLPTRIYEREDQVRARFKIRGRESIKKQLVNEIGSRFKKITKKRLERLLPDIRINIIIDTNKDFCISAKTSPLILSGRYIKRCRGLPQKKVRCIQCFEKGCNVCNHSELGADKSIEGIITMRLLLITNGEKAKFLWLGSEDPSSLVLGNGRPFFMHISNPKIKSLRTNLKFRTNGVVTTISGILEHLPKLPIQFITKTKILVHSSTNVSKFDLRKLKVLKNSVVKFEIKSRIVKKKIYSVKIRQINEKEFTLTLIADGGFVIKQFVGAQRYVEPNISEIIGAKCECILFDILDVIIQ
jgi:tRNA pseudouridine synthase 10